MQKIDGRVRPATRQLPTFDLPPGAESIVALHRGRLAACINTGLADRLGATSATVRACAVLGMPRPWGNTPAKASRGAQVVADRDLIRARAAYARALSLAAQRKVDGAAIRRAEGLALEACRAALDSRTRKAALLYLETAIAALGNGPADRTPATLRRRPRPSLALLRLEVSTERAHTRALGEIA